ncbi:DUF4397 domain-containing protein [Mucilaginibacter sp.]|uniref:DUF4397 domain-containing protein n=1 Tax=Mucilaginibacter sp. TaxID=1882438 RepID=UPI0026230BAB|nr:DUF4397 domain-containing protein [Mucilaginibacter sp.]MDB5031790.1 hypothetical protein [Mucilaginibacter sp.]
MKKLSYLFIGLLLTGITACKKSVITQFGDAVTGVSVKFLHTAPGTPAIDGYVNGIKITPVSSISVTDNTLVTSIVTGISYNYTGTAASYLGLFPGSNYAVVPSGSTIFKVQASIPLPALISAQTSAPGAVIGTATKSTTDGTAYSVFASGLPGSVTSPLGITVVNDTFPDWASGMAYVRLAYMIPNGAPVDMTATATLTGATTATTTTIFNNIAYSTVTPFVPVSVNPAGLTNYTFQLYRTGTTIKLGTVSSAVSMAQGRYYTIIGRGLAADYAVPGTSITLKASARPTLPLTDPSTKYPEIYFAPAQLVFYTNK